MLKTIAILLKICYNIYMEKVYQAYLDTSDDIKIEYSENVFKKKHYHSRIEVYYALTDGLSVNLNGKIYQMAQNSFVVVDSFDEHSFDGKGEFIYLLIPDKYFESYKKIRGDKFLRQQYFSGQKQALAVKSILDDISLAIEKEKTNFLKLEGLVKYLLGTVLSHTDFVESHSETSYDTAKEVLIFISNNFKNDLTLDVISQNLGYNKHYISHLFGKVVKKNLNDYVNGVRLRYFLDNIRNTDSVSEVAYQSGFKSLATFYRAFEKEYGCSPKKYLKTAVVGKI